MLLLATVNVDKGGEGLPLERRFDLLLRFAESRPHVSVAAVGHGRFVDKLEAIRAAYPAGTRVAFLLGFDTLARLFDPKYYADRGASLTRLFDGSECIVANRGKDTPSAVEAFLTRPEVAPFARRIHVVTVADGPRHRLGHRGARAAFPGEPIDELVPPEIRPSVADWGDTFGSVRHTRRGSAPSRLRP